MEEDVDQNERWDPQLWPETDDVLRAFATCATSIKRYKDEDGVGRVDDRVKLRPEEKALLAEGSISLAEGMARGRQDPAVVEEADRDSAWQTHLTAIDILAWGKPAHALIYAAAQESAHAGLHKGGLDEEKITESILTTFGTSLGTFVTAYGDSDRSLPPGSFLHACTASMQTHKDELGADLAIVVGTNVLGAARYRLVLFQAKRATSRCTADVGQNEGTQLDEILSSGMGFYLFYPEPLLVPSRGGKPEGGGRMLPTVRSAEAVFSDVWSPEDFSYVVNCYADAAGNADAVDFAQFLALAMTGEDLRIGRLFPNIDAVVSALQLGGRPLATRILAINERGDLSMHELIVRLREVCREVHEFMLPEAEDLSLAYGEERRRSGPTP